MTTSVSHTQRAQIRRLLLIDDSRVVLDLVGRQLRQLGHDVTTAFCGLEGLAVFVEDRYENGSPFDLVITDISMPDIDGLELIKRIRARDEEVPIVVMSSVDEMLTVRSAIRAGAFDYVLKAEGVESLDIAIRRALNHLDALKRRYGANKDPKKTLEELTARGASGEFVAATDEVEVHVFLQDGRVAWATSSLLEYPFTRYLVEQYGVSKDQIRQVLIKSRGQSRNVGQMLVNAGVATAENVTSALRAQVSAAIAALLSVEDARAVFLSRRDQGRAEITFDLADVKLW